MFLFMSPGGTPGTRAAKQVLTRGCVFSFGSEMKCSPVTSG